MRYDARVSICDMLRPRYVGVGGFPCPHVRVVTFYAASHLSMRPKFLHKWGLVDCRLSYLLPISTGILVSLRMFYWILGCCLSPHNACPLLHVSSWYSSYKLLHGCMPSYSSAAIRASYIYILSDMECGNFPRLSSISMKMHHTTRAL